MDLKLPITINDELSDDVIESTGMLDLASGEIRDVKYLEHDLEADGFPAESEDYEFTCGILRNGNKEVEFRIEVDVVGRKYSITPTELLELKGRAAKLFTAPPPEVAAAAAAAAAKAAAKKRPRK
ncbi:MULTISPECIES: hypothetical protein [Sphaerotilaceae]|jgi:hypothetical protein|uniref:Uncharacterized protein n=2 Tax=Sphaerotilaceae TaxID=2975441 RepID=A0A4Q7LGX7_9BURK|nr:MULTISPECIES: hypothetical protein [Sphaerotilaceae]MDP4299963.1 hypothetical protein [Leptothrix discophora]RZS52967.1 hypothetical protein EV685_2589 [Sphaerotilus mobilis]